jgi:hypothetical protein
MKSEPINVNGKRLNKLEEIVKLLKKLNEDMFSEEEREQEGYPMSIDLRADGSGTVRNGAITINIYTFSDLVDLERFLKASRREQYLMGRYDYRGEK